MNTHYLKHRYRIRLSKTLNHETRKNFHNPLQTFAKYLHKQTNIKHRLI